MIEVLEKRRETRYTRKTYHRTHYEDMWSPYEKCKEIVKQEWVEMSCWKNKNPVDSFTKISNESLARLKI